MDLFFLPLPRNFCAAVFLYTGLKNFASLYDRQLNNWLHDYLYKKNYPASVGQALRTRYEQGDFCTIQTFEEVLNDVLSRCER